MSKEKKIPNLEKPGKPGRYPLEPPHKKNLKALLEFHLFKHGTRPGGQPSQPGKPWTKKEFADTLDEAIRGGTNADVLRNLNNWLRGKGCHDHWAHKMETVLFGEAGQNSAYDQWRVQFRGARKPKWRVQFREVRKPNSRKGHRSDLYILEAIDTGVRDDLLRCLSNDGAKRGWRLERFERGVGWTNPAFNLRLITKPPVIKLQVLREVWRAQEHYHDDLSEFAIAKACDQGGDLLQEKKIRVASEFIGQPAVAIQETDYYSSIMTDRFAWKRIRTKKLNSDGSAPAGEIWDGISAFIAEDQKGRVRLKELGEAIISNQLGGSTLAFSSDGHLMIVYKSDKNLQSDNLLAPSGSGSLVWSDIANSGASDFLSLVRYGAERELREECALDDDGSGRRRIVSKILVTGFVRTIHRAGRPEFYCIGRIEAPAREICERKPEQYVEKVLAPKVEIANWHTKSPSKEIGRVCASYLNNRSLRRGNQIPLSYPLEHALNLLIEACKNPAAASVLDRFMRADIRKT